MNRLTQPPLPQGEQFVSQEDLGITDEDLEGLDPQMVGQGAVMDFDPSEPVWVQTVHEVTPNSDSRDPPSPSMSPRTPPNPTPPRCSPVGCGSRFRAEIVADLLKTVKDPQDEQIMEAIRALSAINNRDSDKLYQAYSSLIRFMGTAWADVVPHLIVSAGEGYTSFLSTINALNSLNRHLHTKHSIKIGEELSVFMDDLKVHARNQELQNKRAKEYQEAPAKRYNDLARTMSELTEKLEIKLLETSKPTGATVNVRGMSPATSSTGPQQQTIAQQLIEIPATRYISSLAMASFSPNGCLTMSVTSGEGKGLQYVNQLSVPVSVKVKLLNRDLFKLSTYCTSNPTLVNTYNQLGADDKMRKKEILRHPLSLPRVTCPIPIPGNRQDDKDP